MKSEKRVSDKDYEHVLKIWIEFEMKKLGEHDNLCLKLMVCCYHMFLENLEIYA